MRGSVRKRGSTWTWYLDVDPNPLTGRRRQQTKGGFKTRKECEAALRQAIADQRGGTLAKPSQRTIAGFLVDEWLPAVKPKLRASTWASYRTNTNAHVVPVLGEVKLQGLSPTQLNLFYAHLLEDGRRRGGGGLSPKTVRNIHVMLHRALKDAVRWGYLPRNAADAVDPPVGRSAERHVWTPDQLGAFLEHVRADRLYALGCWLPRPACAAASSPGCAGSISTSRTPGSRRSARGWWWTMPSRCPSRRPPRAGGRWRWTRPP
jgi:Arm DNA-binding domain/Phage integrase, N-terminal SAM-like domain